MSGLRRPCLTCGELADPGSACCPEHRNDHEDRLRRIARMPAQVDYVMARRFGDVDMVGARSPRPRGKR